MTSFLSINPQVVTSNFSVMSVGKPLEQLSADVFVSPFKAHWMKEPKENDFSSIEGMGKYTEIFKDQGEFILALAIGVKDSQGANWINNTKISSDGEVVGDDHIPGGRFPQLLPISYFLGKNEGDKIEIRCPENGKHFILACAQEKMQDRVESMFMLTYYDLSAKYQNGTLSLDDLKKWEIVSEIKSLYYPYSTILPPTY